MASTTSSRNIEYVIPLNSEYEFEEEQLPRPTWNGMKRSKQDSTSSTSSIDSCSSEPKTPDPKSGSVSSPKKAGGKKRGRKPSKIDLEARLERSRQSARECRARKKQRYQYLDDLVISKEKTIQNLRKELEMFQHWCRAVDQGSYPPELLTYLHRDQEG